MIPRVFMLAILIALVAPRGVAAQVAAQERKDKFIGTMVLEDVDPAGGRKFKLGEDLTYIDPQGHPWYARKGLVFDGASIPAVLWSFVGSPYTGLYRRAAVIHDFYCTNLYRNWQSVHRAFYDAMITDGVSELKAKLMYYAVVRFGPRWTVETQSNCPGGMSCAVFYLTRVDMAKTVSKPERLNEAELKGELTDIEKLLEQKNPDLNEIEKLAVGAPVVVPNEVLKKTLRGEEAAKYGQSRFQ